MNKTTKDLKDFFDKNKKFILLGVLLLVFIITLVILLLPKNTVSFEISTNTLTLEEDGSLPDLESYLVESDLYTTGDVVINSNLDINTPGTYTVTYTVIIDGKTYTQTLTITVTQKPGPRVELSANVADVTVEVGSQALDYMSYLVFSSDDTNYTVGQVTTTNTINYNVLGDYQITYAIAVESITVTKVLTVHVVDTTAPVLVIDDSVRPSKSKNSGSFDLTLYITSVSDNYDTLTVSNVTITESIDYTLAGSYEVIYSVSDSSGNETSISFMVDILDASRLKLALSSYTYTNFIPLNYSDYGTYEVFMLRLDNNILVLGYTGNTLVLEKYLTTSSTEMFESTALFGDSLYYFMRQASTNLSYLYKLNPNGDDELISTNAFSFYYAYNFRVFGYYDSTLKTLNQMMPDGTINVLKENLDITSYTLSTLSYTNMETNTTNSKSAIYNDYIVINMRSTSDGMNFTDALISIDTSTYAMTYTNISNLFGSTYGIYNEYIKYRDIFNHGYVFNLATNQLVFSSTYTSYLFEAFEVNQSLYFVNVVLNSNTNTLTAYFYDVSTGEASQADTTFSSASITLYKDGILKINSDIYDYTGAYLGTTSNGAYIAGNNTYYQNQITVVEPVFNVLGNYFYYSGSAITNILVTDTAQSVVTRANSSNYLLFLDADNVNGELIFVDKTTLTKTYYDSATHITKIAELAYSNGIEYYFIYNNDNSYVALFAFDTATGSYQVTPLSSAEGLIAITNMASFQIWTTESFVILKSYNSLFVFEDNLLEPALWIIDNFTTTPLYTLYKDILTGTDYLVQQIQDYQNNQSTVHLYYGDITQGLDQMNSSSFTDSTSAYTVFFPFQTETGVMFITRDAQGLFTNFMTEENYVLFLNINKLIVLDNDMNESVLNVTYIYPLYN